MNFNQSISTLYFLLTCLELIYGEKPLLILYSLRTRHNSAYIEYINTNITKPQNDSANVEVKFLHDICENYIYMGIKGQQFERQRFRTILNVKFKVRDIIQDARSNMLSVLYESLLDSTNLPKKCPVQPNYIWYFEKFSIPLDKVPLVVLEMNFITNLTMVRANEDLVIEVTIKGRIECRERRSYGCAIDFKRG